MSSDSGTLVACLQGLSEHCKVACICWLLAAIRRLIAWGGGSQIWAPFQDSTSVGGSWLLNQDLSGEEFCGVGSSITYGLKMVQSSPLKLPNPANRPQQHSKIVQISTRKAPTTTDLTKASPECISQIFPRPQIIAQTWPLTALWVRVSLVLGDGLMVWGQSQEFVVWFLDILGVATYSMA